MVINPTSMLALPFRGGSFSDIKFDVGLAHYTAGMGPFNYRVWLAPAVIVDILHAVDYVRTLASQMSLATGHAPDFVGGIEPDGRVSLTTADFSGWTWTVAVSGAIRVLGFTSLRSSTAGKIIADYPPQYVIYITSLSGGVFASVTPGAFASTVDGVMYGVTAGAGLAAAPRSFKLARHPRDPDIAVALGTTATPIFCRDADLRAGEGNPLVAPWGVYDALAGYRDGGKLSTPCALAEANAQAFFTETPGDNGYWLVTPDAKLLTDPGSIVTPEDPVWPAYYTLDPFTLTRIPVARGDRT